MARKNRRPYGDSILKKAKFPNFARCFVCDAIASGFTRGYHVCSDINCITAVEKAHREMQQA